MPYIPMTLEEIKEKQKIVEDKFQSKTIQSNLHRIKGEWVKTKNFKPWYNGGIANGAVNDLD